MPRYLPFLKFFTDMGSTVLCLVHTGLLYVLQQVDRYISVVVWTDPSGCINSRFVHANSWVPITSSRSISSLEDRAITSTSANIDVVIFRGRYSAPALV